MKEQKIYYYEDELNDEFSGVNVKAKNVGEKYKYIRKSPFFHILRFVLYRMIAIPLSYVFLKIKFNLRIKNKKVLKEAKKTGAYIYANHTQMLADPFIPTMVTYPKGIFVVVNSDNLSLKGLGWALPYLGALPLADNVAGMKNFMQALDYHAKKNHNIMIYPEAHIWPYYTKIRPFKSTSFRYPIKYNKPVYCFTNVYVKRGRRGNKVGICTYVDGPFYPNVNLAGKEQEQELRDRVYNAMAERSKLNEVEVIKYERKKN